MDSPVLYLKNCNAPRIAWNVYAYSLVASLGSFVYGYNTGIIAPAIIFIRKSFTPEPSAADVGAIVSIILVGAAIGSFLSGNMADRFGRVKLMTLNSGFMMLAAVTSCLGTSARIIFVARFLLGIGVGVASVVPGLYITEIAPTHVRGRLGALNQLFGWTGVIVAYFVGYEIVNCTAGIGLCWRYMFASGGVLCVAHMILANAVLPETPRWLVLKGRGEEAMQVLLGIYGSSKYESLAVEQFQLASERKKYHETIFLSFKELGNIKNQNALGRSLLLQTAQQLSGNSAVVYYTTSLFHTLGFTPKEALLYNAIASIPQILVLIPLVLSLDRRGRRPALLISQTGVVLSLSVLGAATLIKDDQARFWLLMLGIVMHRASFAAGLGPLPGVITPELMPFEIRSRGMSTSSSFNWLLNFGVTISFPIVFQKLGNSNYLVYWAFAFLSFIGLVMVFWWIPETTGIPLDEGVEPSASSKKTNISNDSMNADEQIPLDRISKTDINGNKSNNGSNNFKFQAELNSQFLDVWKPDANDLLGV